MTALPEKPLCTLGKLEIPDSLYDSLQHKCTQSLLHILDKPIVGTRNIRTVEMYGWHASVSRHVDNQGYVYIVPLVTDGYLDTYSASVELKKGAIIRLYDYAVHSTSNVGEMTALFIGAYTEPQDALAIRKLTNYLARFKESPTRVKPPQLLGSSNVHILPGTVAIADQDNRFSRVIHQAHSLRRRIIHCSHCDNPATSVDRFHPQIKEGTTCDTHAIPID